ncbi:hypothetical protein ACERK3_05835 [Phycisphaerales bacterium AB-hyl4]|uniref:Uncharacterized protein n=1 Tax=Natronomicrosphaera hydrolytica TaxID=3242702 RepID=A0ABV4U4I6_9BACT
MMRSAWLCVLLGLTTTLVLTGCAQTYVNIPAQAGDVASHDPNSSNVRDIQVQAIRVVLRDRPLESPIGIILPEGTEPLFTAAVASDLGEGVYALTDLEGSPASVIEVDQIRIRGTSAEVDVIRPRGTEGRQTVTVYLTRTPFVGWSVERTRAWQGIITH